MEPSGGKWRLSENGKHEGDFDFVVIAHNGESLLVAESSCHVFAACFRFNTLNIDSLDEL